MSDFTYHIQFHVIESLTCLPRDHQQTITLVLDMYTGFFCDTLHLSSDLSGDYPLIRKCIDKTDHEKAFFV